MPISQNRYNLYSWDTGDISLNHKLLRPPCHCNQAHLFCVLHFTVISSLQFSSLAARVEQIFWNLMERTKAIAMKTSKDCHTIGSLVSDIDIETDIVIGRVRYRWYRYRSEQKYWIPTTHWFSTRRYDKPHFGRLNGKDGKSYVISWHYLFVPFFVSPLSLSQKSKT